MSIASKETETTNGRKPETTVTVIAEQPAALPELARKEASVWELAQIIASSRDFPSCRTPEKAAVRILAGKEMGVGPIASVIGIRVENGRVSMDATLMAGCVQRSERFGYRVVENTAEKCTLRFFERGMIGTATAQDSLGESTFTLDDAKTAGLYNDPKKDVWKKYTRNMLLARAMSNGVRWYCPSIFSGTAYVHEELGLPVDEEGRIADGGDGDTAVPGSDLCTKAQRKEIREYVAQIGTSEAEYCRGMGIKILDELSAFEADKAIKGLAKQAAKKAAKEGLREAKDAAKESPATETVTREGAFATDATAGGTATATEGSSPTTGTPQQMLQDAFDDSNKPSTRTQRQAILDLTASILPGSGDAIDEERRNMILAILAKRSVAKIADLSALQAAALIENMERRVAELQQPPFDANPSSGKQ